jgi:hypothetical protein
MMVVLLVTGGIVTMLAAGAVLLLQYYHVTKGVIVIDEDYNGPAQVSATVHAIIRYVLKRSVYMRKFCMQYVLHMMVRMMYYFDILSTKLYAKSRNWFVKNAVRNRGTVPHFWQHLKVYKQEMDQEKEEKQKEEKK